MNRKNSTQRAATKQAAAIMLFLALSGIGAFLWIRPLKETESAKQTEMIQPVDIRQESTPEPEPTSYPTESTPEEPVDFNQSYTWTSLDGKTASARFISLKDTSLVLKRNEKYIQVQLDTFIEEDQEYARRCAQSKADAQQRIAEALKTESATVFPDQPRPWTNLNGQAAIAAFSALEEQILKLRKGSNIIEIPLDELSEDDHLYALRCAQKIEREKQAMQNAPLKVFENEGYKGKGAAIEPYLVYSGEDIPNALNQNISSLILKKGFQATIGIAADGVGLSKVLIAAQRDIRIPKLSKNFNDSIQFIRVIPWHNVTKKGYGGGNKDLLNLGVSWNYNWTMKDPNPGSGIQFVPMIFGVNEVSSPRWLEQRLETRGMFDVILGYNEPDQTNHHKTRVRQKNEYLSQQENCVKAMLPLMKAGVRIGGPGPKQEGSRNWYPAFLQEAKAQNLRIDFIAVHWYDWGSKPSENRWDSADDIFARFTKDLQYIHQEYDLPIWITEFNANPHRDFKTNLKFMKLALPYLDKCSYVERYAWFQCADVDGDGIGNGRFREEQGNTNTPYTAIGEFFRQHESAPAMGEEVYLGKNNLCNDEREE